MKITESVHPTYLANMDNWSKWRLTYDAGELFIDQYLKRYSAREDATTFQKRREMTYIPAFAKAAVNDVKNAIFQRGADIRRVGGSSTYQQAINGQLNGVDLLDSSINSFVGTEILPELLVMSKVGIYVDMDKNPGETLADTLGKHPYMYVYRTEQIRNWLTDSHGQLIKLLLSSSESDIDETFGLPKGLKTTYRYFELRRDGVQVTEYDKDGLETGGQVLALPFIPFISCEINQSLMTDIANYQIALLNLASSDLHYAITSNFPFYTEQFDSRAEAMSYLRAADSAEGEATADGTATEAATAKPKEAITGITQGRRYPLNTERPGFIHPSPEPLNVSMLKQDKMKGEIRELINLSLANIKPKMVSAESRQIENEGLEAGLASIGLVLEATERQIAKYWHGYENKESTVVITYPKIYSLKSDSQRITEADEKADLMVKIPSLTFRKQMAKDIVQVVIGHRVAPEELVKIFAEIDKAKSILDSETVLAAKEQALMSDNLAAELLGMPAEEAVKGAKDHLERLLRIQIAQTEPDDTNGGNNDATDTEAESRKQRKTESQSSTTNPDGTKRVRGKGRRF